MQIKSAFCISLLSLAMPVVVFAQAKDFSGTWQSDSNAAQKWVLDQKDGRIHVQEMNGGRVEADFTCSLNGEECAAKENGRSEKIMMYFNGDKLVEIRERNAVSSKQRLTVSDDGKTLTVETVPLSSDQKAETLSFRRQST